MATLTRKASNMTRIFCLIPKCAAGPFVAMLVCVAAGCSTQEKIVYEPVNTRPIVGDRAMALRSDWSKSVCMYPNGDVAAWSTRYPYQTDETRMDSANLVLDSTTFIAQTAFLPIELAFNPLYKPQVWYGVKYPPTYTAQPPLPAEGGMKPLNGWLYYGKFGRPPGSTAAQSY